MKNKYNAKSWVYIICSNVYGKARWLEGRCMLYMNQCKFNYIPRRKSGIYWIQVRRAAAAAAAIEISLCTQ